MPTPSINFNSLKHFFLGRSTILFVVLFTILMVTLFSNMGCSLFNGSDSFDHTYKFNFDEQPDGWTALFSNYGVGREDDFELESGYRTLPEPLDNDKLGFYLSGKNLSDDLNMFLKHQVDDLEPDATYRVIVKVSFATDAPSGCAGVGGAPGESVTVHVGASAIEPGRIIDGSREQDFYRLNLAESYTGEAQSWYRETEIGDVANSRECEEGREYEIKTITGQQQAVTTDESGNLWLIVGTRSGFEATTSLYYTEVKVDVSKQ